MSEDLSSVNPISRAFLKYLFLPEENLPLAMSFITAVRDDSVKPRLKNLSLYKSIHGENRPGEECIAADFTATNIKDWRVGIEIQLLGEANFDYLLALTSRLYVEINPKSDLDSRVCPVIPIILANRGTGKSPRKVHENIAIKPFGQDVETIFSELIEIHYLDISEEALQTSFCANPAFMAWVNFFLYAQHKAPAEMEALLTLCPEATEAYRLYLEYCQSH